MTSDHTAATDIRVRGAGDPYEIAAVVAVLRRHESPTSAPTGVAAWQRTRRAALAPRPAPRPTHRRSRP